VAETNLVFLDPNLCKALCCKGTACRPLVPPSPCGMPGRASPASRDCIHPFERRLRFCDPEVSTANSSWELTVGSSSKGKPTVTRALTVASRCPARHARKEVAQGSLSSLAALPPRRGFGGVARKNSDYLVCGAATTRTAGKAAGPDRGPCATTPDPDV
jgi:hypothetical protein